MNINYFVLKNLKWVHFKQCFHFSFKIREKFKQILIRFPVGMPLTTHESNIIDTFELSIQFGTEPTQFSPLGVFIWNGISVTILNLKYITIVYSTGGEEFKIN